MKANLILIFSISFIADLFSVEGNRWVFELNASDFPKTKELAEKGNPDAQHKLGVMYVRGIGTKKDGDIGYEWYKKAADQGHARSQYNVGQSYQYGRPPKPKLALQWFLKSANQGYAKAQWHLGVEYTQTTSNLVDVDYNQGIKWLTRAAENNSELAPWNLAKIYSSFWSGHRNEKKALFWFKKSALLGSRECQCKVGDMYTEGYGVTADFIKAYAWLSVSKTNGYPDAPKKLDLLIKRMSKDQIAVGQILASELFNEIENRDEESPVHTKFD